MVGITQHKEGEHTMQYRITEQPSPYAAKSTIGPTHDTAQAAYDYVSSNIGEIIYAEPDADHPDYHDLFVSPGRVLAIEPIA